MLVASRSIRAHHSLAISDAPQKIDPSELTLCTTSTFRKENIMDMDNNYGSAAVTVGVTAIVTILGLLTTVYTIAGFLLAQDNPSMSYGDAAYTSTIAWIFCVAFAFGLFWLFQPLKKYRKMANAVRAWTATVITSAAAVLWFSAFGYVHEDKLLLAISGVCWLCWSLAAGYSGWKVIRLLKAPADS
jgi:hypothetical protein